MGTGWAAAGWAWVWLRVLWRAVFADRPPFARVALPAVQAKGNKKPEWVVRQLVLLKAHLPEAGCRTLALTFNRVFAHRGVAVSKSFVHRVLLEHVYAVLLARKAIRTAKPRAVAVTHCWGIDLTGRADSVGEVHTLLGILDHGSRRALALVRLPRKYGWTLLGHVCLAIAQFGKPRFIRSDNERCFTVSVSPWHLEPSGLTLDDGAHLVFEVDTYALQIGASAPP